MKEKANFIFPACICIMNLWVFSCYILDEVVPPAENDATNSIFANPTKKLILRNITFNIYMRLWKINIFAISILFFCLGVIFLNGLQVSIITMALKPLGL